MDQTICNANVHLRGEPKVSLTLDATAPSMSVGPLTLFFWNAAIAEQVAIKARELADHMAAAEAARPVLKSA